MPSGRRIGFQTSVPSTGTPSISSRRSVFIAGIADRRGAAHDDVELLVDAGTGAALLEMARHDGLARVRAVGADAERGDAELRAERQPVDPLRTAGREPVDPDGLHASASRSASSTT